MSYWGWHSTRRVQPNFSFRGFVHRGSDNPHGWGIAYYPDCEFAAQIIQEPLQSNYSFFAGDILVD
ncbi:MAG: hypothetical protein GX866_05445 [Firmicutes bacterium]|nr:hypothetical protein [Bacillota bacterium]